LGERNKELSNRARIIVVSVAAAALLLVTLQVAYANGNGNTIHACGANWWFFGGVRIVGENDGCFAWEQSYSWNIQGPQGEPGVDGEDGEDGEDGADGVDGVSGWERVTGDLVTANEASPANVKIARAHCPAGKKVLGGGFFADDASGGSPETFDNEEMIIVHRSYPEDDDTWFVRAKLNTSTAIGNWTLRAYAICADIAEDNVE
jgi:hypothetical protein